MQTRTTRAAPTARKALQVRLDLTEEELELLAGGPKNTPYERDDAARRKIADLVAAFFREE